MLPLEIGPQADAEPATDVPLRPSHSYPKAAHHRLLLRPRGPSPLGEVPVAPPSRDAGPAGSSRAQPNRDVRRALRHRPRTTRAVPCTTPAGGGGQPCACPRAPSRYGGGVPASAPGSRAAPAPAPGPPPGAALAGVGAPRPPVAGSGRWGCRTRRRAPPREPNADAHPSPVGACDAARYAFPRSPPADIRWGLSPGVVLRTPRRGVSTSFFFSIKVWPGRVSMAPGSYATRNCASRPHHTKGTKAPNPAKNALFPQGLVDVRLGERGSSTPHEKGPISSAQRRYRPITRGRGHLRAGFGHTGPNEIPADTERPSQSRVGFPRFETGQELAVGYP